MKVAYGFSDVLLLNALLFQNEPHSRWMHKICSTLCYFRLITAYSCSLLCCSDTFGRAFQSFFNTFQVKLWSQSRSNLLALIKTRINWNDWGVKGWYLIIQPHSSDSSVFSKVFIAFTKWLNASKLAVNASTYCIHSNWLCILSVNFGFHSLHVFLEIEQHGEFNVDSLMIKPNETETKNDVSISPMTSNVMWNEFCWVCANSPYTIS